jgi:dethiobiotin synthetase
VAILIVLMNSRILFVTGTDTGVGKTCFAALLTHILRDGGGDVIALKPVCSGGREDARMLRRVADDALRLDEVNPWFFRKAIAPVLAARGERRTLRLKSVVTHVQRIATRHAVTVVEGAGGLLSPMGENFDSRDLIVALDASPLIVCANKLGAVNQVLLVLGALPKKFAARSIVVLVAQEKPDEASRSNRALLEGKIGAGRIYEMPRLGKK